MTTLTLNIENQTNEKIVILTEKQYKELIEKIQDLEYYAEIARRAEDLDAGNGKVMTLEQAIKYAEEKAAGQYLDTGCKIIHQGKNTSSTVHSKSISKNGGTAFYRGLLKVLPEATGTRSTVECESLMLDNESTSDTIPIIDINNDSVDIGHEAKIGRISDEAIFYLMSRGISEDEAKAMIVRGFVEPISKELPLEYAVELNKLIELELEGTIG